MHSGPVILNNTPLVALWVLNRLDLLQSLYDVVSIPTAVRDEFLAVSRERRQQFLARSSWIQVTPLHTPEYALTFSDLDAGEAEVLALAVEQAARLVIIDERKGRRYAKRLGLPVTGTLGVLLAAKARGMIVSVAPLIDILLENGLYLHSDLIERTLQAAGEKMQR